MDTFARRIEKALLFESFVERRLLAQKNTLAVAKNGTEHTHPDFTNLLRGNIHPTSKWIRFQPDGVFLCDDGMARYYECKSSINIEKDAYEQYLKIENITSSSVIIFSYRA